jgi:transposase
VPIHTLAKLGEKITETLESIPRTYKVIQTVREKFTCRVCATITHPAAPFIRSPAAARCPIVSPGWGRVLAWRLGTT